ncbi:dehydration-responsive element-binding protein 2C-like [Panicum virgatum]|uniref:dehydration-responsive element-binding protein 2C-like n=1 Tax=Panicum virgatum TaxID=38727 RepID=UPI0019D5DEAB|nr:dehydration-responsive element-binding protein 2C-like [Panicum virgatum]
MLALPQAAAAAANNNMVVMKASPAASPSSPRRHHQYYNYKQQQEPVMMAKAMTHSAPCSSADDASPNSNCSNYSNSSSSAATTPTAAMQQMIADKLAGAVDHSHQQQQAEAEDFEDYVTRLPKAEDFGLGGFQEVPPPEVFDEAPSDGLWDHTVAWPPSPAMMLDSARPCPASPRTETSQIGWPRPIPSLPCRAPPAGRRGE